MRLQYVDLCEQCGRPVYHDGNGGLVMPDGKQHPCCGTLVAFLSKQPESSVSAARLRVLK